MDRNFWVVSSVSGRALGPGAGGGCRDQGWAHYHDSRQTRRNLVANLGKPAEIFRASLIRASALADDFDPDGQGPKLNNLEQSPGLPTSNARLTRASAEHSK